MQEKERNRKTAREVKRELNEAAAAVIVFETFIGARRSAGQKSRLPI